MLKIREAAEMQQLVGGKYSRTSPLSLERVT